jgi:hypothetical protein
MKARQRNQFKYSPASAELQANEMFMMYTSLKYAFKSVQRIEIQSYLCTYFTGLAAFVNGEKSSYISSKEVSKDFSGYFGFVEFQCDLC